MQVANFSSECYFKISKIKIKADRNKRAISSEEKTRGEGICVAVNLNK